MKASILSFALVLFCGFFSSFAAASSAASSVFKIHSTTDKFGRQIVYYLSQPEGPAPLLLVIQGSGCEPIFDRGPMNDQLSIAEMVSSAAASSHLEVSILAVEKPFAGRPKVGYVGASGCGIEFDRDFSADRWLVALQAALFDSTKFQREAITGIFVLGHSEGAPMAALVASRDQSVKGVALFSGPGETQVNDVMMAAYARGITTKEHIASLLAAEQKIRDIMNHPNSTVDYAWGWTYLRWSSFFHLSALELLRQSKARIYIGSGTADQNVPFWSSQLAVAGLLVDRRPFHVRVIPDGDHSLRPPGANGSDTTIAEYARALEWLLAPAR